MKKELIKISIRNQAIFISDEFILSKENELNETTMALVANVQKLGFVFSEDLLRQINTILPKYKLDILACLKEVVGVGKNWTPLVKEWNIPTGESVFDHLVTLLANVFKIKKGTRLQCGHLIPEGTFPLERYNGCPFCGTPFEFGELELLSQGSKSKVLELWTNHDLHNYYLDLLTSKVALDATQVDSLTVLLKEFPIPENIEIGMKETMMLVIDKLVELDRADEASVLFKTPNDILRYLWFKHTGFLQIIEPKTIVKRKASNKAHITPILDESASAFLLSKDELKLKYNRSQCKMVAYWMNVLPLEVEKSCEIMHPKRGMWVRFIRALRLAEYSKKQGFEKLATLLDVFYNEKYQVWQGRVNYYKLKLDAENTFRLLKMRPGLFARSLFSNMLWFGADVTLKHFSEILDTVPARLILTLNMYAKYYFEKGTSRMVKPLGGKNKKITSNAMLDIYTDEQLSEIKDKVENLCIDKLMMRFAAQKNKNKSIYIAPELYKMPLAIGDRSENIQDLPSALMGTRFSVEGETVRLFMQWGEGLKAQHLDMDLSCSVAYPNHTGYCSYSNLVATGCKHSGDIRSIPNKVGTAEYIDVNINELAQKGAEYVSFTCNAYSAGDLSPNMVVGWMDSKHPMKISEKTGVAYDPSCVQHQVRIGRSLAKGMVFGVLDVAACEIVWLEMSFGGQVVQNLDVKAVKALLAKLESKLNIGYLLEVKAVAQDLEVMEDTTKADEVYDFKWAINSAAVSKLFVD